MNPLDNALSEIAPTLADLKRLRIAQKTRLLLARLKKIDRNESSLNKRNLLLPGDPYGLAYGYADGEKKAVKEHLLGAPWINLVNEGYLVDLTGHGFHRVSEEGGDFMNQEPPQPTSTTSPGPSPFGFGTIGVPSAFVSYSWDGTEHQDWVSNFATRLRQDGIEVIFDRWHLQPGQEKQNFMEQAVTKSNFVVVICTENYAKRANDRDGGVGYESMIISAEMADHILTEKFIPVLKSGSFKTSMPLYIKSRMGVDLSGTPYREDEYDRLIRVLHGESTQPPPIGQKPNFSKGSASSSDLSAAPMPSPSESVLGSPKDRPNAIAYAQYDKPGLAGSSVNAHARLWDKGEKPEYSFETSQGAEFLGSKDEVISRFFEFQRGLLKQGYRRMSFTPGSDPDFNALT